MSKTLLIVERSVLVAKPRPLQSISIKKDDTLELIHLQSDHRGILVRAKTAQGDIVDLEPRVFNQNQIQPLLREAYSRR